MKIAIWKMTKHKRSILKDAKLYIKCTKTTLGSVTSEARIYINHNQLNSNWKFKVYDLEKKEHC